MISHPVIQSFIIASALLIALRQLKFLLDIPLQSNNIPEFISSLVKHIQELSLISLIFSCAAILILVLLPKFVHSVFLARIIPLIVVISSIIIVAIFDLEQNSLKPSALSRVVYHIFIFRHGILSLLLSSYQARL